MNNNRIKSMRKAEGLSQKELGIKLGVGQTTVSAWESGRNEPDYESLKKMAKELTCSIDYLMGYLPEDPFRGLDPDEMSKIVQEKMNEEEMERYFQEEKKEISEEERRQEEKEEQEMIETWEQMKMKVYKETMEIDRLFEKKNLDKEERKRAVELLNIAFDYKEAE